MDRPRQQTPTPWYRHRLLRTTLHALVGTAVAALLALPAASYYAGELSGMLRLPIPHDDVRQLVLQGSSYVFAYMWVAFYMLERIGERGQPGITTTNGI